MTEKRYSQAKKSRRGFFFVVAAVACAAFVLFVGINLNLSSAGAGSTTISTLGLSETSSLDTNAQDIAARDGFAAGEGSLLTKATNRNIDKAVDEMLAREEAERRAAEEARLAAEAAKKAELEALQARAEADASIANLEVVDWTMSHDQFVAYWGARIDVFLAGFPLAGQGVAFAEAAWNYGIDPRLSPAISNTESTRGRSCFLPYNAWGWGSSSWGSWEEAIDAHVRGLKNGGYGPMITYWGAQKYCPPSPDSWYRNTLYAMSLI